MTKNQAAVWVILVGWNSRDDLLRCLGALQAQTYPVLRVILIDNGSLDRTAAAVRSAFPDVRVLALSRNVGFARAVNAGLRYALDDNAGYALLLNPDTWFEPEMIEGLVVAANEHPKLGILSPKVYLEHAPGRLWGVGGLVSARGLRFLGIDVEDHRQFDTRRLDFVFGCTMLIRMDLIRQIGLLDERFFVFFEEIDLCLRAGAAGWTVAMEPRVSVRHTGGGSTTGRHGLRQFYLARSRMIFLRKHRARFSLPILLVREANNVRRAISSNLRAGENRAAWSFLCGLRAGLARRPAASEVEG